MNNSNLSVNPSTLLCHLAKGDITYGWSQMNVGFLHLVSMNSPTNLSINLDVVLGFAQSTSFSLHNLSKNSLASSVSRSLPYGNLTFNASSSPSSSEILFQGVEKSSSIVLSLSS